jgi:hypothetical protein
VVIRLPECYVRAGIEAINPVGKVQHYQCPELAIHLFGDAVLEPSPIAASVEA